MRHINHLVATTLIMLLTACGGGGGDSVGVDVVTYTVGGSVSGLTGTLVLRNNGGDALTRSSNGGFTFATPVNDGASYSVTVASQPAGQNCSVSNGSGTVAGGNVSSVTVSCVDTGVASYTVGGTLSGLTGSVVLHNNGGDALTRSSNGGFTFASPVNDGASYSVTVASQPTGQNCSISNGSGTVSAGNVTSVTVSCVDSAPASYTVGGTLSGLSGTVVLQNNGGDNLSVSANGAFTFATELNNVAAYSVTVLTQPAGQSCSVLNGSGTVAASNITTVAVTCSDLIYSVGGTVTGLAGTVVLQNNSTDNLFLSSDGSFTFGTMLNVGSSYNVTVLTQPSGQICMVSNGSGSSSADVSTVQVTCSGTNIALTNMGITTQSPSIVAMPIHAKDKGTGLSVRGLTTSDFLVKEDATTIGVESYVTSKPVGEVPYLFKIVVAVDVSSSITLAQIEQEKSALLSVVNNLQPNQQLAIYTFDDVVQPLQGFTSDKTALSTAIGTITRGSPSTNLYGAISTGAAQWSDSFTLSSVTYGALLVITDGDDTSGLVTKTAAQAAVANKQAYIIPVGAAVEPGTAGYQNMVDIFGAERVISSSDFSVLTNTLDTIRSNLLETFAGLYYVYYASPSRSGTHTIDLSVVGNGNTASDSHVTGSFSATGFTSVIPQVVITGPDAIYVGEPVTWSVETLWSNDPPNYSWDSDAQTGQLAITADVTTATLEGLSNSKLGTVNVTSTDNNWAKSATKAVTINASRAPASVTVTQTGYQKATVTWSTVTGAIGYRLYWSTTPGVTVDSNQQNVGLASSFEHTSLVSGQSYYYRVATLFDGLESGLSSEQEIGVVVPAITDYTRTSAQPGAVALSWTPVGTAATRIYWNSTGSPGTSDAYLDMAPGVTSYVHACPYVCYYMFAAADGSVLSAPSSGTLTNGSMLNVVVNGLTSSGLVLQNNGGDDLAIAVGSSGNQFGPLPGGGGYNVTVANQPGNQLCSVTSYGTGTMPAATPAYVTCLNLYTIGGTVEGLTGSGLVLQNNGGDDLSITAGGGFVFSQPMTHGSTSTVTILQQPSNQVCAVYNTGGLVLSNVTVVRVVCTNLYTIGGSVTGLSGTGLVLQNNGGDDLAISADGAFSFVEPVLAGAAYDVTILGQPSGVGCNVTNANGTASSVVTNITVTCVSSITVSANVSGLTRSGLILQNNRGDDLSVPGDGTYTFASTIVPGSTYDVSVLALPVGQGCSVTAGSGSGGMVDVTVSVACTVNYPVLSLNYGPKQLQFSWSAMPGATYYQLWENPDGVSGYTQVGGDLASTTTSATIDIAVHRFDWLNARYMVYGCTATGCEPSDEVFTVGNSAQAIGQLTSSRPVSYAPQGVDLSADGNTLVMGSLFDSSNASGINGDETDTSLPSAGAAFVFVRSGGLWVQQAYIKASNPDSNDFFGSSVELSDDGNTLVVGASDEASVATGVNGTQTDNSVLQAGAAYVFYRSGDSWSQQAYIKPSATMVTGRFGASLALSHDGNTLAVGGQLQNSVHLFVRSGSTWSLQGNIVGSNTESGDYIGSSVALSDDGNTLAVGAMGEDSSSTGINATPNNLAPVAGAAYIFTRSGTVWSQQAFIKPSNTESGDLFGASLALSDDGATLAVGARNEASAATGINGLQTDNSAAGAGAVYLFTRSGAIWSQQAYIKASNAEAGDGFGIGMSLSGDGNLLVVTAHQEDSTATGINGDQGNDATYSNRGAAFLFNRSGGTWTQKAYIKPGSFIQMGMGVSLSDDGNTLIAAGASSVLLY